ncbi:MAG: helix-turn-helix domain-containing protein [Magnetococcales bacterium]|nr:helix-turn-helix domain-containing protein [Magnetococcales bacterium]
MDNSTKSQIESSCFSTEYLANEMRFSEWRRSIATLFDVSRPSQHSSDEFNATIKSSLLSQEVMLARCDTVEQRWQRSVLRFAEDGLDHYLIQVQLDGKQCVSRGNKESWCTAGNLMVIDLADKHDAYNVGNLSNFSVIVSRHMLSPLLHSPDSQEGRVLSANQPIVKLAIEHMKSLEKIAHNFSPEEAASVVSPTLTLLASALNGSTDHVEGGQAIVGKSILLRCKAVIEQFLRKNDLSVDFICRQIGISRTNLYLIFKPYGGIQSYIIERRLRRCAEDLLHPEKSVLPIYTIAENWGFTSTSHFSRIFKKRFGASPGDIRQAKSAALLTPEDCFDNDIGDRHYEHWLLETLKC